MYKSSIAWGEIFLLVSASIAFSYLVHQTDSSLPYVYEESTFVKIVRQAFLSFFGANLVSAEEPIWTCPLDTNGARCQEYGAAVCDSSCTTGCFQGARRDFADCREGTCLDPVEGTCSPNTPQVLCQEVGGNWDARPLAEIPACRPGCCLMGSQALFRTEQACDALRSRFATEVTFQPVASELACLALAHQGEEGACVLDETEPNQYACRFTTKETCTSLEGTFYTGLLCSHPDLNTTCTKQSTTSCVEGKDEVYWFDSCGNRENIYDSIHREDSWNSGFLLGKNDSCALGSSSNPLLRQSSCGNCNYLLGNRCGAPRAGVDNDASVGNVVCQDLSCTDDDGTVRKHGESWCAFDSRIGVQGNAGSNDQRSVDVPGSQHYRKTCANGIVSTETCGSFRTSVCVESAIEGPGSVDFSQAACRPNQWQLCVAANREAEGIDDPTRAAQAVTEACERHTDCYVKSVDLRGGSGSFALSMCLPKYPPAFDLHSESNGEEAQALCSFGTVTCKYVTVKRLFGGSKKYNTLCVESAGVEAMNNLCMSLGDCGAHVNIAGDYSGSGFRVSTDRGDPPALSNAYIAALRVLADPRPDQRVALLSTSEVARLLGLSDSDPALVEKKAFDSMMMVSGFGGAALAYGVYAAPGTVASVSNYFGLYSMAETSASGYYSFSTPALGAYLGAAAGALIGAAGVAYILDALGITAGLPAAATYALIGLGAFAGGAIGYGLVGGSSATVFGFAALSVGLIALVAVVVIIAIIFFLGIGKKKETKVNFQCLPWQPPLGGARCETCGDDGLPCTQYACQSLGQTCRYLEDSAEDQCVDSGRDDVAAPVIREDASVLISNYRYQASSERGYQLIGPESNGCVPRFASIQLGIATDELAQCKVSNRHTENFDSMNEYFHRFNDNQNPLFRRNHTMQFSVPSNEALENEYALDREFDDDPEERNAHFSSLFLPDSSGNVNLYVRCTDASGNKNLQEYAINFCVTNEPDRTAPIISRFEPATPAYVALNATERPITFWLNEPAECRWSEDSDRAYGAMTHDATCATGLADGSVRGWACNATLPLAGGLNERTFYMRCNDQPWINVSDATNQRNANSQGVPYVVKRTQTPLRITSLAPQDQTLFVLGLPARVNFSVSTSGGAEGQARYCSYRVGTHWIRFFETGGDRHRQNGITLVSEGNYSYPVVCEDTVGNTDSSEISFRLVVDDDGPQVTRVYNSNGKLTLVTNEPARCAFSLASCSFNFVNGTLMVGEERIHSSPFQSDLTHYLVCRDIFGNPSGCTTVRGGTL